MNEKLRPRPGAGASIGGLVGVVLAVGAMVLGAARGNILDNTGGITLFQLSGIYVLGGILGGVLVGGILPFARRPWGAALLGIVGIMPFYLGIKFVFDLSWFSFVAASILIGGGAGFWTWMDELGGEND